MMGRACVPLMKHASHLHEVLRPVSLLLHAASQGIHNEAKNITQNKWMLCWHWSFPICPISLPRPYPGDPGMSKKKKKKVSLHCGFLDCWQAVLWLLNPFLTVSGAGAAQIWMRRRCSCCCGTCLCTGGDGVHIVHCVMTDVKWDYWGTGEVWEMICWHGSFLSCITTITWSSAVKKL